LAAGEKHTNELDTPIRRKVSYKKFPSTQIDEELIYNILSLKGRIYGFNSAFLFRGGSVVEWSGT